MADDPSPVRYADSRGFRIAWQEFGSGARDVAFVWGMPNHIEVLWELPSLASFLRGIGRLGRIVHLDQRGTGLSDRVALSELPDVSERTDDVIAVMDAAGMDRVTLIGESEGAPCAVQCALRHPERVDRLILLAPALRGLIPDELRDEMLDLVEEHWGESLMVELQFPTRVDDPRFRDWFSRSLRQAASPGEARALLAMDQEVDETASLSALEVPTLVLVHSEDPFVPVEDVRRDVRLLKDGSLVVVPGKDRTFGSGEGDAVALAAIAEFLEMDTSSMKHADVRRRAVLFTDIVGSTDRLADVGDSVWTETLERHDRVMSRLVREGGGEWVKSTGDGVLAMFERVVDAVSVADAANVELDRIGVAVRAGVHVGDVHLHGSDVAGMHVHVASRISDLAGAGQVVLSSQAASEVAAASTTLLGEFDLKGVPGRWSLYQVDRA